MKTSSEFFKCIAAVVLAYCATSYTALAVPVTFDLRDVSATLEIESGTITRDGITATLLPSVQGSAGVLNQTASGFGINATGSADDTDELDKAGGIESILIKFNVDVVWQALSVSSFGVGEQGSLAIGAFSPTAITSTGSHFWNTSNVLLAGEAVVLSHVAGTGFSFDSFTVERWFAPVASVPDGGSSAVLVCLALGGVALMGRAFYGRALLESTIS